MRGHVDSETLAAFREELLPRRKAGRVAAHLAHCDRCAGLDAQLADLPGLLAHTSAPPMPDALTARIEAALSAEAAARSALTPAGAATEAAGTAVRAAGAADAGAAPAAAGGGRGQRGRRARRPWLDPGPGRSRLALRIAAAAAAVVVVGGGGYGVSRLVSGGETGQASTASRGSAAAPGGAKHPVASPEMGPAEHGTGSSGSKSRLAAPNPAEPAMLSSGTNYRAGQLKTQVEAVLLSAGGTGTAPKPSHLANGAAALTSCLKRVAGNQRPLLVDTARYNGRPATIIVLTTASAKTRRVVVVGPGCSATRTGLITTTTIPVPH